VSQACHDLLASSLLSYATVQHVGVELHGKRHFVSTFGILCPSKLVAFKLATGEEERK